MKLLRKYGLWIGLAMIACIAGAAVVGSGGPRLYSSTAQVDVEARVLTGSVPVTPNLTTEKSVVTSGVVLGMVAPSFGLTRAALASDIAVTVPASTNILSIACSMGTPVTAQRCAAAMARAYADFRNDVASNPALRAQDPLGVTVVTPATPGTPAKQRLPVLLSIGAVLGLALGIGSAFARDRLDDRVRDNLDLQECLDAPVLATIPRAQRWASPGSLIRSAPLSAAAEAFRRLRVRIDPQLSRDDGAATVVLVTGSQTGEGRTCVASNLGQALAQAGASVLLVDTDQGDQSLSQMFRAGGERGLAELLTGKASLAEVTVHVTLPSLRLVPAGLAADSTAGVVDASRVASVFAELRAAADVIIVDAGPTLSSADPVALIRFADIALVVANVRTSRRAAVRAVVAELRAAGTAAISGVVTDAPAPWRSVLAPRHRNGGMSASPAPGPFPDAAPALPSGAEEHPVSADPASADTPASLGLPADGLADDDTVAGLHDFDLARYDPDMAFVFPSGPGGAAQDQEEPGYWTWEDQNSQWALMPPPEADGSAPPDGTQVTAPGPANGHPASGRSY